MKIKIDSILETIGKTRYFLSQISNVSYPNIVKLCDGNSKHVSLATLDKIATALQVDIEDLIEVEEHEQTKRRLRDYIEFSDENYVSFKNIKNQKS
ncbi:MAG: helix-turn-helix domain-containing protein [Peptostreptococcaceae bacterium]